MDEILKGSEKQARGSGQQAAKTLSFHEEGYVVLPSPLDGDLLKDLREGLAPILELRDSGQISSDTRHQTLLEPKFFHRSFLDFLNLPELNQAAEEILGTGPLLFYGIAALLGAKDRRLNKWHRDFSEDDPEVRAMLKEKPAFIQFNVPLYDDQSLWIVPGSHNRLGRPEEKAQVSKFDGCEFVGDYGKAEALDSEPLAHMPGAVHVKLKAGQILLYNSLMWHGAEYRPEWKRATLHGGWRAKGAADRFKLMRWGLDHNPWFLEPSYMGDLGPYFGPQLKEYQNTFRKHIPSPRGVSA